MSVLGKRTRASAHLSDLAQLSASSKRRSKSVSSNKGEKHGFRIHQDHHHDTQQDVMQIDGQNDYDETNVFERQALSPSKGNRSVSTLSPQEDAKPERCHPSPQTPRHRDALSKGKSTTPRHRVRLGGTPLTPRTPHRTANLASQSHSIYSEAKRCFFDNATRRKRARQVIGRDNERDELQSFISTRFEGSTSGALYISGPPGTGKSALVHEVVQGFTMPSSVKHTYVNCMALKSANDVYSTLLRELEISDNIFDTRFKDTLGKSLLSKELHKTYFVVLDEIDALLDIDVQALNNIFEWALDPSSRLILIGIANALDLTDRFLPNLRARGLKPQLLPFLPYSATDIALVLTTRLKSVLPTDSAADASFTPVLMPAAIQLISKKVAAQTGDLRKAFDLAQKAICAIEAEIREQKLPATHETQSASPPKAPLGENLNLSSPRSESSSPAKASQAPVPTTGAYTAETAPRASISHVVRITSAAFNNGTKERLLALNLQQKAVLCSLAALERYNQRARDQDTTSSDILSQPRTGLLPSPTATPSKKRVKMTSSTPSERSHASAPEMRQAFEAYSTLCSRENMLSALTYGEFRGVICSLETMGLLSAANGKTGSFVQVATPTRKGRGVGNIGSTRSEERRVHGTAGLEELKACLDNTGCVKALLNRMLEGHDL